MLRLTQLKIENVLGIRDLEFKPGAGLNFIVGPNKAGKTSLVEAIIAALSGGGGDLLREGAEKGAVEAEIGTERGPHASVRRPIGKTRKDPRVKLAGVPGAITAGQTFLAELADLRLINPIRFLQAKPEEQVAMVLESFPCRVTRDQLAEALRLDHVGQDIVAAIGLDALSKLHGLEAVAKARKAVYEARYRLNQQAEACRDMERGVRATAPAVVPGAKAALDSARERLQAERQGLDERLAELQCLQTAAVNEAAKRKEEAIAAANRAFEGEVKRIYAGIEEQVAAERLARHATIEELVAAEASADMVHRQQVKAEEAERIVGEHAAKAVAAERKAAGLTAALGRLDKLRESLVAKNPFPGVETRDGAILVDGIPLHRVNTQAQIELALEIAKARAGKLGVVCLEGIMELDYDHQVEFCRQAVESGLQFFVTIPGGDRLMIVAVDDEAGAEDVLKTARASVRKGAAK